MAPLRLGGRLFVTMGFASSVVPFGTTLCTPRRGYHEEERYNVPLDEYYAYHPAGIEEATGPATHF